MDAFSAFHQFHRLGFLGTFFTPGFHLCFAGFVLLRRWLSSTGSGCSTFLPSQGVLVSVLRFVDLAWFASSHVTGSRYVVRLYLGLLSLVSVKAF
ncbi:hypothetical protein TSUD_300490 [Trifolium subterraneum]|uniref:Uncharacterized protein n=1 Tax=Trifolium subterraneum TaxID=3900 RepID=A0A2Z6NVX0_TRISU|nr:hypothetical protein TSUD_300490 [Trifolium subterraneum]